MWLVPYGIIMHQVCHITKIFHQVGYQNKFCGLKSFTKLAIKPKLKLLKKIILKIDQES